MLTYIFEFDIVPGQEDAFWEYMEEKGAPFWLQFPQVKSYEVFSKLGGHGSFEGHVELESFSDFDEIWCHPDLGAVAQKTAQYTCNIQRRFLVHKTSYSKK